MSDVVYLYGFVPGAAPAPPPTLTGVGGSGVTLLDIGDVRAAVSRVVGIDPATLESRLEDLAWVGEQGLAHEAVVAWFVDRTDILPVRLFSLHTSEASLRTAVRADAAAIAGRLRTFAGLREWNVKVAYDADELARHAAAVSAEVRALDQDIADAAPGRRFLLQRKRADLLRTELRAAAARLAADLLDALAEFARDRRTLPLGAADIGTVVLNAALLVHRSDDDALRAAAAERIDAARRLGMLVSFSGPWAPYRFMEDDVEA